MHEVQWLISTGLRDVHNWIKDERMVLIVQVHVWHADCKRNVYSKVANGRLRWLDWIFWGWYLPTFSINYVGMSKDMEKMLPQLYYIKMKNSYDLGFVAVGVAMAT